MDHRVGTMSDEDPIFRASFHGCENGVTIGIVEIEAVLATKLFETIIESDIGLFQDLSDGRFSNLVSAHRVKIDIVYSTTCCHDANRVGHLSVSS